MLQVTTMKNYLKSDAKNEVYCFRSNCSEQMTSEKLIKEMIQYNSTLTEPDARAAMSILGELVERYIAKGYDVELPFCWIHLSASGTCETLQQSFNPDNGDNKFGIKFQMKKESKNAIFSSAQYEQIESTFVCDPRLYSLGVVNDDSSETNVLTISRGKILRVHGRNISFDISDAKQGVFLGTGEDAVRLSSYSRIGSNIIDVVIPSDATAGEYKVKLTTKPGVGRYKSDYLDSILTVVE